MGGSVYWDRVILDVDILLQMIDPSAQHHRKGDTGEARLSEILGLLGHTLGDSLPHINRFTRHVHRLLDSIYIQHVCSPPSFAQGMLLGERRFERRSSKKLSNLIVSQPHIGRTAGILQIDSPGPADIPQFSLYIPPSPMPAIHMR